jgi:large conductance mechanosensitive channel
MIKGFKEFLLRGNLVELAVAFVIGAAFAAVVKALVDSLITPVIALIVGKPDFSSVAFSINGTEFPIGLFIGALFTFVSTAAAVYFFVVVPYSKATAAFAKEEAEAPAELSKDQELLSEIRDLLAKRA